MSSDVAGWLFGFIFGVVALLAAGFLSGVAYVDGEYEFACRERCDPYVMIGVAPKTGCVCKGAP